MACPYGLYESLCPRKERVLTTQNSPLKISALSPFWMKGMCCFEFTSLSTLGERGDRKAVGEGVFREQIHE